MCKRLRPRTFLGEPFCIFFYKFELVLRITIPISKFGKKILCLVSHFLLTLMPNVDETALGFHFASISGLGGSILSKKVEFLVPYCTVYNIVGDILYSNHSKTFN